MLRYLYYRVHSFYGKSNFKDRSHPRAVSFISFLLLLSIVNIYLILDASGRLKGYYNLVIYLFIIAWYILQLFVRKHLNRANIDDLRSTWSQERKKRRLVFGYSIATYATGIFLVFCYLTYRGFTAS